MSKNTDYPVTPAVRFLRTHQIDFEPYIYVYEEHGGTGQFAQLFGVDEHQVVKTLVLQNEAKKGLEECSRTFLWPPGGTRTGRLMSVTMGLVLSFIIGVFRFGVSDDLWVL